MSLTMLITNPGVEEDVMDKSLAESGRGSMSGR
jgi:hypothetical protein